MCGGVSVICTQSTETVKVLVAVPKMSAIEFKKSIWTKGVALSAQQLGDWMHNREGNNNSVLSGCIVGMRSEA